MIIVPIVGQLCQKSAQLSYRVILAFQFTVISFKYMYYSGYLNYPQQVASGLHQQAFGRILAELVDFIDQYTAQSWFSIRWRLGKVVPEAQSSAGWSNQKPVRMSLLCLTTWMSKAQLSSCWFIEKSKNLKVNLLHGCECSSFTVLSSLYRSLIWW